MAQPMEQQTINPTTLQLFIESLREAGFNIGMQQHIAAQDLLLHLASTDQLTENPRRFSTYFAPVLCTTPEEQDEFSTRFAEWLRLADSSISSTTPMTDEPRPQSGIQSFSWRRIALFGVIALLIAGLIVIEIQTAWLQNVLAADSVQQFLTSIYLLYDSPNLVLYIAAVLLVIVLISWGYLLWQLHNMAPYLYRRRSTAESATEQLHAENFGSTLIPALPLTQIVRNLRRRSDLPSADLDVPATIRRTVEVGGWPTPIFKPRRILPEYLFIIERTSAQDHQARYFEVVAQRLSQSDVFVNYFYFDSDPRLCFSAEFDSQPHRLDDLIGRYSMHRLVIFADCRKLLSPSTGHLQHWVPKLFEWPERAVVTPVQTSHWGSAELAAASHFQVLPASIDGFVDWATGFNSDRVQTYSDESVIDT
ncbi:MAG: hypothetical protein AAF702_25430 [Chloroflexota bacterium]